MNNRTAPPAQCTIQIGFSDGPSGRDIRLDHFIHFQRNAQDRTVPEPRHARLAEFRIANRQPREVIRSLGVMSVVFPLAVAGCGRQPLVVQLAPGVKVPEKRVVIFFPDGLDERRLNTLLAEGKLPHIRKRFVEGGVRVKQAVNSIPALTYPNAVSLFTGQFPGHHGIVGNQWFDRRNMFWINYITAERYLDVNRNFKTPTLYERIPHLYTVNVQGHTHRGATLSLNNPIETGFGWAMGWYKEVDQFVGGSLEQVAQAANREGRWPSVLTFYFPGVDQVGHLNGPESTAYGEQVINFDAQVGRVTDALQRADLLRDSYLVLATDHGHIHTQKLQSADIKGWLATKLGLKCHEGDLPRTGHAARRAFLDAFDVMVVDGSHRRIMLHVRGAAGWDGTPTPEEVEHIITGNGRSEPLHEVPGVEFVCSRAGPDRIAVRARPGAITVERRRAGSIREYRIVVTDGPTNLDALGLSDCPKEGVRFATQGGADPQDAKSEWNCIAGGWLSSEEWLRRTAGSRHPDFVPQIVEYFDSPCAGDIVIFAADGWVFSGHGHGEHGSCLTEDMRVPLFFAGPHLPQGRSIEYARLVDVMPTILDLLGASSERDAPPEIDGVSLAQRLRSAMNRQ